MAPRSAVPKQATTSIAGTSCFLPSFHPHKACSSAFVSGRLGGYVQVKCAVPGMPNCPPISFLGKKILANGATQRRVLAGTRWEYPPQPHPRGAPTVGGSCPAPADRATPSCPLRRAFLYAHMDFSHVFICSNVLCDLNARGGLRKETACEPGCSAEPCPRKAAGEQSLCSC